MALIKIGVTKCVLTGDVLEEGNSIVCFPPFEYELSDPFSICYDACALRSAFEIWKYKTALAEKISKHWQEYYSQSTAFEIILQDNSLIIAYGMREKKIRVLFLEHVFSLDFPLMTLPKLLTSLRKLERENSVSVEFTPNTILNLKKDGDFTKFSLNWKKMKHQDHINLSSKEWIHFYSSLNKISLNQIEQQ